MHSIPGYSTQGLLREERTVILQHAFRESDQKPALIKLLKKSTLTTDLLSQLQHEFEVTRHLNIPGVIKPLEQGFCNNAPFTVFEFSGGTSLRSLIQRKNYVWYEWVPIVIAINELLEKLHNAHVVHQHITPDNLFWNFATSEVTLIDFSDAMVRQNEQNSLVLYSFSQKQLDYVAPEQTGRTNRAVDYRTDFYGLGATLYELVTGVPPFVCDSPQTLVHCHIAKKPSPPHVVNPDIPVALSEIILKLLSKDAIHRYQSSVGLNHDLQHCLDNWHQRQETTAFLLGSSDVSTRFQVSQKLYSRGRAESDLRSAFARVEAGSSELFLINGEAGVGKTSLVNSVRQKLADRKALFVAGKPDSVKHDRPYMVIVEALQSLAQHLLVEAPEEIERWRERLGSALGPNAKLLLQLVPDFGLILDQSSEVPELPPLEEKNRFKLAFLNLLKVFSEAGRPVVIFLDDLHRVDSASLELLESFTSREDLPYVLLIGAYRTSDHACSAHFADSLERLRLSRVRLSEVSLKPLAYADVVNMLVDTLHTEPSECHAIATLCLEKTRGNPFFLNQFLQSLYNEGLIFFRDNRWQWQQEAVEAQEMTDNVLDLMVAQIQRFSPRTQEILKTGSCIGTSFSIERLSSLTGYSLKELIQTLQPAVDQGLILAQNQLIHLPDKLNRRGIVYRFAHDRFQQAVYSLIDDEQRRDIHLRIGNSQKRDHFDTEEAYVFELIKHLNIAVTRLESAEEKLQLARWNAQAGRYSRQAAAFDSAYEYFTQAIRLLSEDSWESDYELSLSLYTGAAEAAYITSNPAAMDSLTRQVMDHARSLVDKVRVYEIRIQAFIAANQFSEAIDTGIEVLGLLGIALPKDPSEKDVRRQLRKTQKLLRMTPQETLPASRACTKPEVVIAQRILSSMFGAVKFSRANLRPLLACENVKLMVKHGRTSASSMALASYGGILCGQVGAIDHGYALGQLAQRLAGEGEAAQYQAKTAYLFNTYIRHWKEPLSASMPSMLAAHKTALQVGDVEYGAYNLMAYIQYLFIKGTDLSQMREVASEFARTIKSFEQKQSYQYSQFALQAIDNLSGLSHSPTVLDGVHYKEHMLNEHRSINHVTAINLHHYYKTVLCLVFNEYEQALEHALQAEESLSGVIGTYTQVYIPFLTALAKMAQVDHLPRLQRLKERREIRNRIRLIETLAKACPANHQHHLILLEAEWHRTTEQRVDAMELYDEAIKLASENGFALDEALANELAGRFYEEWGKSSIASTYLNEAYLCYLKWGAKAKVSQMEQHYGIEFNKPVSDSGLNPFMPSRYSTPLKKQNQILDFASVIKSTQAISDEIVLSRVLEQLLDLALESAGAQRAVLILNHDNQLTIEAEASLEQSAQARSEAIESSQRLPASVVHFVARTREHLLISRVSDHEIFSQDEYVKQNTLGSLMCLPMLYHGRLTGLIYLEHRESRDIFTSERLGVLQVLASQAAISIENAKLYEHLENSEKEYRSLFENAVEGIFRISPEGRFISANPSLVRMMAYPDAETLLESIHDVGSQCFARREDQQRLLGLLVRDRQVIGFETQWLNRQGQAVAVSISVRRVLDPQSQLLYYEGSVSNITERLQRQTAELAREKAEAASQAKSDFLATVSHEIRTPLNGILGMSQLMLQSDSEENTRQRVGTIHQSAQLLLSILNDVLDFSKIEAGQLEIESSDFSISQVVSEVQSLLRPLIQDKGIRFIVRIDPAIPPLLKGDRRSLYQILMNLCSNAVKFTEEGSVTLRITAVGQRSNQQRLQFEVQDTGIGIPKDAVGKIFDSFSQADSSITRRYGGTGLGLAITKKLVELQKGRIQVENNPDGGCRFWFTLEYQRSHGLMELASSEATPVSARSLNILLVEDVAVNQEVTKGLLEIDGHRVDIAEDGFTALSMHHDNDYDVVLMDIHLPDMDGMETTRRMRKHPDPSKAGIRVIAVTAALTEQEKTAYTESGINHVIGKPVLLHELRQVLGQAKDALVSAKLKEEPVSQTRIDHSLVAQHQEMLGADKFHDLVKDFKTQTHTLFTELEQADFETDAKQIASVAHKLAGACANFGLEASSASAKRLETVSQSGDHEATLAAHDYLIQEYQHSVDELDRFMVRGA